MTVRKARSFPAFVFPAAWLRGLLAVSLSWLAFAPFSFSDSPSPMRANAQEAKPKEAPEVTW